MRVQALLDCMDRTVQFPGTGARRALEAAVHEGLVVDVQFHNYACNHPCNPPVGGSAFPWGWAQARYAPPSHTARV